MVSVKARPLLFPLRADNTHNHWRGLQDEELDPDRVVKRSAVHFRSFNLYSTVHAGYMVQLIFQVFAVTEFKFKLITPQF